MKRIFTVIAIAVGLVLPMYAQFTPVTKEIKNTKVERSFKKKVKAEASEITINDLVGTFEAYAMSAFQGAPDEVWEVTVTLDETDANKVWLQPVMQIQGIGLTEINPISATYNQDKGELTVALGQTLYGGADQQVNLVLATADAQYEPVHTGEITLPVTGTPKNIVIVADMILGCGDLLDAEGWWYQALGYTTFTKAAPVPVIYVTPKGEGSLAEKVQAEQLFFVDYEGETYLSTTPEYTPDAIAGTYEAYAMSAFEGYPDEKWTVTITRDEADNNKVWISPIFLFAGLTAEEISPVYGMFDETAGTLSIPLGQTLYQEPGYTMILGLADVNNNYEPKTTGDMVVTVVNNGDKFIEFTELIGAGNLDEGAEGWWYQALGYTTFTSKETIIAPLSEIATVSRELPTPEIDGYFDAGAYTWDFQISQDGKTWDTFASQTQFEYTGTVDLGDFYGDGAEGVMANEWSVSGFMEDLGYFELNGGTAASFNAYSYSVDYEGAVYEFLDLLDPSGNPVKIGSITLQNQDGSTFVAEVLLGEYSDNMIYYNLNFVVDEGVAYYGGEAPVLWFITNNQAYLLANFDSMTITRNAEAQAVRQATKINFLDQPIAIQNIGGIKKNTFSK